MFAEPPFPFCPCWICLGDFDCCYAMCGQDVPSVIHMVLTTHPHLWLTEGREQAIEVGAHLLWQDAAHASGQRWSGFRFITVPDEQMRQLREWIDGPGGQFE